MSRLAPARAAARWSATHPWRAISLWFAFVAAAIAVSMVVSTHEVTDADYRVGESGRAAQLLDDAGLADAPSESVLITADDGVLDAAAAERVADEVRAGATGVPGVAAVGDPITSPDGAAVLVPIILTADDVDPGPLLEATATVADAHPDLRIEQAGDVSVDEAINDRVAEDLHTAEFVSIPITLLLMLLAFGALIAAGLPVLLAGTSVAATIGLSAAVSHIVPAEQTVFSMIVLIGMAVGVDYSLFYLKRERQERQAGHSTLDAVAIAAETSGHAILLSGGAVIASLCALFVLTDVTFNSLAAGSILVVAIAVLGSITVLPALLVKLGRWVDRPRIPLLWRATTRVRRGAISSRLLRPAVKHPVAALLIAAALILALSSQALSMKTHGANLDTLPQDIPEVATLGTLADHFPSEGSSADVVLTGVDADAATVALTRLDAAARDAGFPAGAQVTTSSDGRTSVLELPLGFDESDERADGAVQRLRSDLAPAALDAVGGEWAVGGDAAESLDTTAKQSDRLPYLIGLVLLLTMAVMVLSFRSVLLGLVSTVLNLASVGVAFGVLTLVFQKGVGADLLGFTSPGFVIDWIPIFVLVVLVGLSMDYHVFVLSRVRELVADGVPVRAAVHRGTAETAGVITSAAAVMVAVFSVFAVMSLLEMKMMGVGLAAAILLDATLIRLVVLPAVLVLLGGRVWPGARRPKVDSDLSPSDDAAPAGQLLGSAAP